MIQEMTFTKQNGRKIQGRMYLPGKPEEQAEKWPVVIFSHGFGGHYRELVHHGEGFAEAGICCLFFDFCGGGEMSLSDGCMEEMTVGTECGDLKTVVSCIKELNYVDRERIFLQGESMGGLVSALVAAEWAGEIRGLVLWYPAFSIPEDAARRHRAGETEVFGICLGSAFDIQAMDIDVYREISAYTGPVLMIHGTEDAVVPVECSRRAMQVYENARLIEMPGAGHGYDGADSAAAREHSIAFLQECCRTVLPLSDSRKNHFEFEAM